MIPLQILMGEFNLAVIIGSTIILTLVIREVSHLIAIKLNLGIKKDELIISSNQQEQLKILQETMLLKIQEMHTADKKELEEKFAKLEKRTHECDDERHNQMIEISKLKDKITALGG